MEKRKKKGFILISIGIFLPLFFLLFASGFKTGGGFFENLFAIKVVIALTGTVHFSIPYRFVLAFGVILIFLGIRNIDLDG